MRLIELQMTAFGPYKDKETICFTNLENRRLFVISGATGAGKTTIFDAITYALYGTASGTDRYNIYMMRSHFADDDLYTSVQLTFQIQQRTYRIYRQMGHIKEGNVSRTGERYEFVELTDGKEASLVDRPIVTEINEQVERLIGLTVEQFRQIVMLPQGEFRKLLTSDSENKEAILRRLFQTERYQLMNELLKEKEKTLEQQYVINQQTLIQTIQSILNSLTERKESLLFALLQKENFHAESQTEEVLTLLDEEESYYERQIKFEENLYKETQKEYEIKHREYTLATVIHEKFNILKTKEKTLQSLLEKEDTINEKRKLLELARKAKEIEPYEAQWTERKDEKNEKETESRKLEKKYKELEHRYQEVKMDYEKEKEQAKIREELTLNINRLEQYIPTVEKIEDNKQRIKKQQLSLQQLQTNYRHLVDSLRKNKHRLTSAQQNKEKLEEEINKAKESLFTYSDLHRTYELYIDLENKYTTYEKLKERLVVDQESYNIMEKKYNHLEHLYYETEAILLSKQLIPGEPCPVCGSKEHFTNVTNRNVEKVSREQLKKQELEMNKAYKQLIETKSMKKSIKDQLNILKKQLEITGLSFPMIKEKRKDVEKDINNMSKIKEVHDESVNKLTLITKEIKQLEQVIKEQEAEEATKNKIKSEHEIYVSTLQATVTEQERNVPEEYHDYLQLTTKITDMKSHLKKLEDRWVQLKEQYKQIEQMYMTTKVQLASSKEQLIQLISYEKRAHQQFYSALTRANFNDENDYKQAKKSFEEQEQLKQTIDAYDEKIISLTKDVKSLQDELKDKEVVNLEKLAGKLETLQHQYEQSLTNIKKYENYKRSIKDIKQRLVTIQKNLVTVEEELVHVKDLYNTLRGQNNKRISFERYLQIDYLDQIIYAANLRFKELSNGQYHLVRSHRQEAYGRQSGLSIDVYDSYTGKIRDVKTLSGGEKFIASLCLALGMSDIIQSNQGNIQIETMFIDEGFGSLDEESLHKSIEVLVQLQQSGRMIGVISHVEQLKRIFPAVLEVSKTKEGYSTTSFILR